METPRNIPDNNAEEELSLETKKQLVDFWRKAVVGEVDPPKNLEDDNLKEWLYKTIMEDAYKLTTEWQLLPNQELIKEIASEKDKDKKSELEFKFLESIKQMVGDLDEKFKKLSEEGRLLAWNSSPRAMRKNKDFDCTGATLLGNSLLSQASIESYHGSPGGHSVNIAKLSNGEWVWLDLKNKTIQKIDPTIREIDGGKLFDLSKPISQWEQCYVTPKATINASIIGNFYALQTHAIDKGESSSGYTLEKSLEAYKDLKEALESIDLGDAVYKLWPGKEMAREIMAPQRKITKKVNEIIKPIEESGKSLDQKMQVQLITTVRAGKEMIIKSFQDLNVMIDFTIPEVNEAFQKSIENLKKFKEESPEIYPEVIEKLAARIRDL